MHLVVLSIRSEQVSTTASVNWVFPSAQRSNDLIGDGLRRTGWDVSVGFCRISRTQAAFWSSPGLAGFAVEKLQHEGFKMFQLNNMCSTCVLTLLYWTLLNCYCLILFVLCNLKWLYLILIFPCSVRSVRSKKKAPKGMSQPVDLAETTGMWPAALTALRVCHLGREKLGHQLRASLSQTAF